MKAYIIYTNDFDDIKQYYELEHAYMETSTRTEVIGKNSKEVVKISIIGELPLSACQNAISLKKLAKLQELIADRAQQRD